MSKWAICAFREIYSWIVGEDISRFSSLSSPYKFEGFSYTCTYKDLGSILVGTNLLFDTNFTSWDISLITTARDDGS